MEVCPVGRADPPLQGAHGGQAVSVQDVREGLLPLGPPLPAHEEAHQPVTDGTALKLQKRVHNENDMRERDLYDLLALSEAVVVDAVCMMM